MEIKLKKHSSSILSNTVNVQSNKSQSKTHLVSKSIYHAFYNLYFKVFASKFSLIKRLSLIYGGFINHSIFEEKERTMRAYKIFISLFTFLIGGLIYLLFRSKTLLMFRWCEFFGIDSALDDLRRNYTYSIDLDNWVKFSLPDGLWLFSYLLLMDILWENNNSCKRHFWISALPLIAICSEIMQYEELLQGTFDIIDLYCYLSAIFIFIITKKLSVYEKSH